MDWVAYHNLMGVDCFVLWLDRERMNTTAAAATLTLLRQQPSLIALVNSTSTMSQAQPQLLAPALQLFWSNAVDFFAYVDSDEFLVGPALGPGSPTRGVLQPPPPPNIIPFLRAQLAGRDLMYLHRWDFGYAGRPLPPDRVAQNSA